MAIEAVTVDARGMRCPWPVLRAAKAMRGADAVTVIADDPQAPAELQALAEENGWFFATYAEGAAPSFRLTRKNRVISGV